MTRVVLPGPSALARIDGETALAIAAPVAQLRRPFVRFFACERDLSLVVGAMAGG